MAGRPRLRRELVVWLNDQRVGRWSTSPSTGHAFSYDAAWLQSPLVRPLSLALPLSQGTRAIKGAPVQAYFENLLPASPVLRQRLQAQCRAASLSAFDLLSELGRDCVGAVQLLPAGEAVGELRRIDAEALDERQLVALLNACVAAPDSAMPDDAVQLPRVALGGAQAKTALLWHQGRWCRPLAATPTSHILKLPLGAGLAGDPQYNTSLENEWLCARLLQAIGFEVPASRIERIGVHKVLVIERFDRRWVDECWWLRLPMEDLCQATATLPERARESAGGPGIARLLDLLRGSDQAAQDRERFLAALVVGWMLAATELHAKNFSVLLRPQGHYVLAPLVDVISAWPILGRAPPVRSLQRLRFALACAGEGAPNRYDEMTPPHWLATARRAALGAQFAVVLAGLAGWAEQAIELVAAQLPADFPSSVSEPIFAGLRRSACVLSL